jgi:hypothetical protein
VDSSSLMKSWILQNQPCTNGIVFWSLFGMPQTQS